MFVGIDLDLPRLAPAEAGRQHEPEFAASRLLVARREAALPHQAQLVFRHRPLQPEQQAIVDEAWIVGAVRIDDQAPGKRAQVDQMMPVPPVARQTRRLDAVDGADIAGADQRHQAFEPRPLHAARSGAAEVVVDYRHRGETRGLRRFRQVVLPALAFEIADDLRHGRLANIDDGGAGEMISA